jgi:hypothetical protein
MEIANTSQTTTSTADETVIVSVGAEGGSVKLLGRRRAEGTWEFRRVMNDSSWSLLGEETDPARTVVILRWVSSWDEALGLLDINPWAELRPLAVHPEFRGDVLAAVRSRLLKVPEARRDERMAQWVAVCSADEARGRLIS